MNAQEARKIIADAQVTRALELHRTFNTRFENFKSQIESTIAAMARLNHLYCFSCRMGEDVAKALKDYFEKEGFEVFIIRREPEYVSPSIGRAVEYELKISWGKDPSQKAEEPRKGFFSRLLSKIIKRKTEGNP